MKTPTKTRKSPAGKSPEESREPSRPLHAAEATPAPDQGSSVRRAGKPGEQFPVDDAAPPMTRDPEMIEHSIHLARDKVKKKRKAA
jgi:hypothetical protein